MRGGEAREPMFEGSEGLPRSRPPTPEWAKKDSLL